MPHQYIEVKVPDIGDFTDVPVAELLVKPGDTVEKETPLVTLETDKATVEIPAPQAGAVKELKVKLGDRVTEGSVILILDTAAAPAEVSPPGGEGGPLDTPLPAGAISASSSEGEDGTNGVRTPSPAEAAEGSPVEASPGSHSCSRPADGDIHADVVVLGAGPGGYTAAFRAADLGKKVILIERYSTLGGVCLNVGCIPSKALLNVARIISEAEDIGRQGVSFGKPAIELERLRSWKESVVARLTGGLTGLARQRNVEVVQGKGKFTSPHTIQAETASGLTTVSFENCIIAAGSSAVRIPGFPYDDPRIMDSSGALALDDIPGRMLIIGGGIIGLEMATVYDALGSRVTVVEMMNQLIPGTDTDLTRPLLRRIRKRYEAIYLGTRVSGIEARTDGLSVTFEEKSQGGPPPDAQLYDRVLVAVGRRPNGGDIGAENAGVSVDERGFIQVNQQLRTSIPHIFAIGDVAGEPMLAHKATHEGKLAAEIIAGGEDTKNAIVDVRAIPSVAYTDPEIAWMGLTEAEAGSQGIDYEKAVFPWTASGRALAMGRDEGLTKLLLDKKTRRLLGAGIVGINAGELIAETVLALEMGADMEDIGLVIHPHPTLSETISFASEIAEGSVTDLYMPK